MPGLRLLLRIAPFLVGAVAAAVWLRRRTPQLVALPAPHAPRQLEARYEPIDIVTVVDDLLAAGR
jgi:uncharacterized membrane protein